MSHPAFDPQPQRTNEVVWPPEDGHPSECQPTDSVCRPKGHLLCTKKVKTFPHSLPRVGPGADPGVQAVSRRWLKSHPSGGRLPLLSARPAVTFPAEERHRPSAGTKLYCLVTEAYACEQLAQGCYLEADRPRFEPATFRIASERSTVKPHRPLCTRWVRISKLSILGEFFGNIYG